MATITRYLHASTIALCMAAPALAADPEARARAHYDRAVELFSAGDYPAALLELERAGELRPSYKLFHSMAQVHAAMNDPAAALDAYRKYLEQGGQRISPERRREVSDEMAALARRVGTVTSSADAPAPRAVGSTPMYVDSSVTELPGVGSVELAGVEADGASDEGSLRKHAWVGWVATGVLAAGATATGLWALSRDANLEEAREDASAPGGPSRAELESSASSVRTLATATDVLWIAAAAAGGVSLWLTFGSSDAEARGESAERPLRMRVGASGVSLDGSF